MQIRKWFSGQIILELTSADIGGFLSAAQTAQIELLDIEQTGPLNIRFRVKIGDCKSLSKLVDRRGERLKIKKKVGLYWQLAHLRKRPVLLVGILILLVFSAWVPGRIFFLRVEGNSTIPSRKILETAVKCGMDFGASRREVRSEKMKNALLDAIPELSWAGVNTYGCTAVITVEERAQEHAESLPHTVSSIVASRDGVICDLIVVRGSVQCAVGQAVKQGQVLISGYNDCGLCIQATNAKGEIFARTNRSLTAVCPTIFQVRREICATEQIYSLIIGNKRINFANSSGISGAGCAKIYEENYVMLPGGFQLPLAIGVETLTYYSSEDIKLETPEKELSAFSKRYLLSKMCAGSILLADEKSGLYDGFAMVQGEYSCNEMIGISRTEENLLDYVENG